MDAETFTMPTFYAAANCRRIENCSLIKSHLTTSNTFALRASGALRKKKNLETP